MPADPVLDQLTGPGGPFEIVTEPVLGVPLQVYKDRLTSFRDIVAMADARAEVDFIVQGDRRLTFGEHNALVRRVAAAFLDLGIVHGDRVAILSANNPEWVVLFWAAAALGVVVVPLNAWWKTEELEFGLRDSGAKLLCCDARRWALVRDTVAELEDLEHVFVMDLEAPRRHGPAGDRADGDRPGGHARADRGCRRGRPPRHPLHLGHHRPPEGRHRHPPPGDREPAEPVLPGRGRGHAGRRRRAELATDIQAGTLLVVPLFHVTGCLATMTVNYASGAKLVLMPPGRFDVDAAMRTIEQEKVTTIGGVPTIMWRLVEAPNFDDYDLSTVTRASYGGAPAAPELVQRIRERFPKVKKTLATAYGLTETASVATSNVGDDYATHPDSVGRTVPTVEVRVVDEDGADVPVGETGEIWLRGPTIMLRGYWNRPEANAEAITPEGWFRSGDIGRFDTDGFLYLVDRAKDMIIRAGENVYCVEIEQILFEHPDIVDAAVVGVPHRELGEEVKAVVQLRDGSTATVEDVREHCRAHLADFKVPEYVELRDEPLPRNPAGKVLKSLLRGAESAFAVNADDDSAL